MKTNLLVAVFFTSMLLCSSLMLLAGGGGPDTVRTGVYVTSIHDIDFKQKEYTIDLWLWLKYKNPAFDFLQNLEIPQAKTVTKSFSTIDTSSGRVYILMKLQCVMKDTWRIRNFPFDHQNLRFSIENSQYDYRSLVFATDTLGKHYDPRFVLPGWRIDSFTISSVKRAYETTFGDETLTKPHVEYSSFKVRIGIQRSAGELFWKMFLGMYVAFLIAYVCFYIHADNIDSRFGLSVGSLFAAIGNKYIIDSALPESNSLTLVDILHGLTLLFIFLVVTASARALYLVKKNKLSQANRFDMIAAQVLLVLYVILNIYFISKAIFRES
ncbi:MAG: hypothetical protein ABI813_03440 [Bacteroidota bacterium]